MCQRTNSNFVRGITADVEPHAADLADTLPWMCPNDTGISGEAPKLDGLTGTVLVPNRRHQPQPGPGLMLFIAEVNPA